MSSVVGPPTAPFLQPPAPTVSFAEALRFWLELGFISFGGPAGQIAIMHTELVERRRWINEQRFLDALNFCMLLPGPEAQQLATYIGWLMHRTLGGIVAGALFVLPSLFILIALSWVYVAFGQLPLVAGLAIWAGAFGALVATSGVDGALAQMAWFFTKAALLTFGGAYAVPPYVYQGAVEQQHWLGGAQMMDGLALGEATPGPLIMVVAFVGFVGGWSRQVLGPDALFLGAALAAGVVTFFTFLPSFVFILAGGPLVESTHGKLGFTAPLTAITAAVVGVILNLTVFFAVHVLWPQGLHGRFDAVSASITAAAMIALFRFRVGVIPLLLGCAVLGLALSTALAR